MNHPRIRSRHDANSTVNATPTGRCSQSVLIITGQLWSLARRASRHLHQIRRISFGSDTFRKRRMFTKTKFVQSLACRIWRHLHQICRISFWSDAFRKWNCSLKRSLSSFRAYPAGFEDINTRFAVFPLEVTYSGSEECSLKRNLSLSSVPNVSLSAWRDVKIKELTQGLIKPVGANSRPN